uniref:Uncharacterized protein n=1 Tax=Helianthus annuus TaxID=4232 RepID=A0A251SR94_HELAN
MLISLLKWKLVMVVNGGVSRFASGTGMTQSTPGQLSSTTVNGRSTRRTRNVVVAR